MNIFLIRHTSVEVKRGICYGHSDIGLGETMEEDIAHTLQKLPGNITTVISSPLKRCTLLAERISPGYTTDARLKELNFGTWEMKLWDEIPAAELDPWMGDFVNTSCPGGESYRDMYIRCSAFYSELTGKDFTDIAVVAHGGFIRTLLCHILSIPLEKSFSLKIDYGSVSCVEVSEKAQVVKYINR